MTLAFVSLSLSAPVSSGAGAYTPVLAMCGFGPFTLDPEPPGGARGDDPVPVLTQWPSEPPLLFGAVSAAVM